MGSLNQVVLCGRLGADPDVRYTQGGSAVVSLSMATDDRERGADGQWVESTMWHRLKAVGKTAELIGQYCRKGDQLSVSGRLAYWQAEGAKGGKLSVAEIIIFAVVFDPRGTGRQAAAPAAAPAQARAPAPAARPQARAAPPPPSDDFADDDIPF